MRTLSIISTEHNLWENTNHFIVAKTPRWSPMRNAPMFTMRSDSIIKRKSMIKKLKTSDMVRRYINYVTRERFNLFRGHV